MAVEVQADVARRDRDRRAGGQVALQLARGASVGGEAPQVGPGEQPVEQGEREVGARLDQPRARDPVHGVSYSASLERVVEVPSSWTALRISGVVVGSFGYQAGLANNGMFVIRPDNLKAPFCPEAARSLALGRVKKVEIEGLNITQPVYLARHVSGLFTRAEAKLWEFVQQHRDALVSDLLDNLADVTPV